MKRIIQLIKKIPLIKRTIKRIKPANLEETLLTLFDRDRDMIIIDVGANTGQSIDFFLKLYEEARVFAFEPTKKLIAKLKTKYGNTNNISIIEGAISNFTGTAELFTSEYSATNSLLKPKLQQYEKYNKEVYFQLSSSSVEQVQVMRFDEYYNEFLNGLVIDIFKTDTQGNDCAVLDGASTILREKVKCVIAEVHYSEFYEGSPPFFKTFELLYNNGFIAYNIIDSARFGRSQLLESNVVFVNRRFHDMRA